jgi:hypothetical protein
MVSIGLPEASYDSSQRITTQKQQNSHCFTEYKVVIKLLGEKKRTSLCGWLGFDSRLFFLLTENGILQYRLRFALLHCKQR